MLQMQLCDAPCGHHCYCSLTVRVSFAAQRDFVFGLCVFLSEPVGLGEGEVPGPRDAVLT